MFTLFLDELVQAMLKGLRILLEMVLKLKIITRTSDDAEKHRQEALRILKKALKPVK